jgi:hypothetical protein
MTRGIAAKLEGQKFGHLTVLERAQSDRSSNAQWLCLCGCGKQAIVRATFLKKGQIVCSKACPLNPATQVKDIAGQMFGALTAIRSVGFTKARKALWLFECSCGKQFEAPSDRVLNSGMKSCGTGIHKATYKHGLSKTRGYKSMHFYKYMTAKTGQTPKWLTEDEVLKMAELYVEASRLTKDTGIAHEVDHVYPLQGKTVCGLHILANLRIVTRAENRRKTNKLLDDVC